MMAFIGAADQEKLRARFERDLQDDVRLVLFVQPPSGLFVPGREEPQTGRETQQLLEELAALSPKLRLEVHNASLEPDLAAQYEIERSPALVLLPATGPDGEDGAAATSREGNGVAGGTGLVRFFGLPGGYEFMTLIEDLVDLSRGRTRLSAAGRQAAAALPGPVHLQVFVTPT